MVTFAQVAEPSPQQLVDAVLDSVLRVGVDPTASLDAGAAALSSSEGRWKAASAVLALRLDAVVGALWRSGWQPSDVLRVVTRVLSPLHVRLVADVLVGESRRYARATLDPRWAAALDDLGTAVWWSEDESHPLQWGRRERLDRWGTATAVRELLRTLAHQPRLERLLDPPGTAGGPAPAPRRASSAAGPAVADAPAPKMLSRVRALLAKAESTEFPDEAEALTAKAQELIARYSISAAMLDAESATHARPTGVRIGVDNPYEAAKALLLASVAAANRCRTVWSRHLGFVTVVGFGGDLDVTELLYTSLLVQATASMNAAGSRSDRAGRSRTRAFRQSFLVAYATRIGQRLEDATAAATDDALAHGVVSGGVPAEAVNLLPVLARRDEAVNETTQSLFPGVVSHRVRISDGEGWSHGTAAADSASLHARARVTS